MPFLVLNSPDSAEGVETGGAEFESKDDVPASEEADTSNQPEVAAAAVEFVITTQEVFPDIVRLSAQASSWTAAREEAIADGRVEIVLPLPPSDTDLSLLPQVDVPVEPEPEPEDTEPEPADEPSDNSDNEADEEGDSPEPSPDGDGDGAEGDDPPEEIEEPPEESEADPFADLPAAPAQVDGRVPPPAGGPTAAQWNAVRNCESTHNYQAVSPTGKFRGAYQFSQQTWDWVAGIHFSFLVGVDPAAAPPGWQDVMAYTLFAMRGWQQWPECGVHLL